MAKEPSVRRRWRYQAKVMPALLKLCCDGELSGVFDFCDSDVRVHFTHQIAAEQRISNEIFVVPHVFANDL